MGRSGRSRRRTRDNRSITRRSRRYIPSSDFRSLPDYSHHDPFLSDLDDLSVNFVPDLRHVEDRRRWSPSRSPKSRSGGYLIKALPNVNIPNQTGSVYKTFEPSARIGFDRPQSMSICERRKRRREVMFARRKNGRGGQRKPRWSEYSYLSCKRRK